MIVYDVFAIGDAVSQSAGGTFASSISVTGNVTATEGMTSRSEDVFNNRRIQINASANDTDEGLIIHHLNKRLLKNHLKILKQVH